MIQDCMEVSFEVATNNTDVEALKKTLIAILDSQLDTGICCTDCFTFVPPFEQKVSDNFYSGTVTVNLPSYQENAKPISWFDYINSKSPKLLTAGRIAHKEV